MTLTKVSRHYMRNVFSCEDAALQVLMSVCVCVCGQFTFGPFQNIPFWTVPEFLECSRMCQTIRECSGPFQNVPECVRMFQNVSDNSRMFWTIPECSRMCQTIPECSGPFKNVLDHSRMFQNAYRMFQNACRSMICMSLYAGP